MLVSRNWLQTFFAEPLPSGEELEEILTFHSCEVELVTAVGDDTVIDVKVLPDKSAWMLSHRGVAKELSTILNRPLKSDPLTEVGEWESKGSLEVVLSPSACDHYEVLLIKNVKVGPSPDWLSTCLETLGQRSINNVVDITNYAMLGLGQPLHAFDAGKLGQVENKIKIGTRLAKADELITTLSKEEKILHPTDTVIIDANTDTAIAIGGVKGGMSALVDEATTTIILESAHFDRKAIRQTARRLDLLTDAAKRYENGAPRQLVRPGLTLATRFISDQAGGEVVDFAMSEVVSISTQPVVSVSLAKINSVLGLKLSIAEVTGVWERFGYKYEVKSGFFTVTPPSERDDLVIPEDLIEEVGRMIGLAKIQSIPPVPATLRRVNKRQHYATKLREVLLQQGFFEVVTSSFRAKDEVPLQNALASDKSFLRSSLIPNLIEARERNLPHRDLLGIGAVKIFEIGTTFTRTGEQVKLGLAVQTGTAYKAKIDRPILDNAKTAVGEVLGGNQLAWVESLPGGCEIDLDAALAQLPEPTEVVTAPKSRSTVTYQPFSVYPAVSRDVAFWVTGPVDEVAIRELLKQAAGDLCVRLTHLDTFMKDGQTSLAYRLVFQSTDRTLEGGEVERIMETVYKAVKNAGFIPR